jgi:RNA recognition motif-containing protein
MGSREEAEKAITMFNGFSLLGRPIAVNEARPKEERSNSNSGSYNRGGGYGERN